MFSSFCPLGACFLSIQLTGKERNPYITLIQTLLEMPVKSVPFATGSFEEIVLNWIGCWKELSLLTREFFFLIFHLLQLFYFLFKYIWYFIAFPAPYFSYVCLWMYVCLCIPGVHRQSWNKHPVIMVYDWSHVGLTNLSNSFIIFWVFSFVKSHR